MVAVLYKLGVGISIYSDYAQALSQGDTAPDISANARDAVEGFGSPTWRLLSHAVLHTDEMPVARLKPGNGKTHRANL